MLGAEGFKLLAQRRIVVGQQGHRKQGGIGRARCANGKGGHGHALGHLHDAVQRIHARQGLGLDRHTQHRHHGFGCDHARQMGRAACPRDDGLQTPFSGALCVGKHIVRHSVGRNHASLVSDAKLLENLDCVLHGVPVGAGTHDDADERLSHWVLFVINVEF